LEQLALAQSLPIAALRKFQVQFAYISCNHKA